MPDYVINRLHFRTNARTILSHIKSKALGKSSPAEFSFNSIRLMPESMKLMIPAPAMARQLERLSLMNSDLSFFDPSVQEVLLSNFGYNRVEKQSEEEIHKTMEEIRQWIESTAGETSANEDVSDRLSSSRIFDQAIANYNEVGFFAQLDWRLAHWGTAEDVLSVVKETFELPTSFIEFQTKWSPPITAVQSLVNAFPSVRFELLYHYPDDESWKKVEFFPTVPFGY